MPAFQEGVEVLNNPQVAELESSGQKRLLSLTARLLKADWSHAKDFNPLDIVKEYEIIPGYCDQIREQLSKLGDSEGPYCRRSERTEDYDTQIEYYLREDVPNRYSNPNYNAALTELRQYFAHFNLTPEKIESVQDIDEVLSALNTSAGWDSLLYPGMQHKEHFVHPERHMDMEGVQQFVHEWGDVYNYYCAGLEEAETKGTWGKPTVCFSRTQAHVNWDDETFKRKKRLVQCVGLRETILGRKFLKPVDELMSVMPMFGPGKTRVELNSLLLRMKSEAITGWTWDYSKYDSTIPAWAISDAFSVMKEAFHGTVDEQEWSLMVHDFIHKYLVSYDAIYYVHHGTASGHPATTAVNCIVNALMTLTVSKKFNVKLNFNVFGDDNCCDSVDRVVPEEEFKDMCGYLTTMFGIEVQPEKCQFRKWARYEYPEYLSTVWRPEGAWRDPRDLLDHMIYPERFRVYGGDLQPWIVVYDYILAYPAGMRALMRVDDFVRDYGVSVQKLRDNPRSWRELPYNVRTNFEAEVSTSYELSIVAQDIWRKLVA